MGNSLWNLYARFYDSTVLNFSAYGELLARIEKEINPLEKKKILNIGCGTANLEKSVRGQEQNFTWIGIDQSEEMLSIGQHKLGDDSRFQLILHDMNDIESLQKGAFDFVLMVNSLYVASYPQKILEYIYNNLSNGGKLIISNPKETSSIIKMLDYERKKRGFLSLLIIVIKLFPSLVINLLIRLRAGKGSYHFLSKKEMQELIVKSGLSIVDVEDSYAGQSIFIIATK